MKKYDAAVIGGGLLGCFAARELMRYDLSAVLIEAREDVCTGISRANTAVIYAGYDNAPHTLKAELTVRANRSFDALCRELEVPFSRCGELVVGCGERAGAVFRKKLGNGLLNGVEGLRILSAAEARELEPSLSETVSSALYSPANGTVDPWRLCYAAYENALANGCEAMLNTELSAIRREDGGYILESSTGEVFARTVINCAGLSADRVHELLFAPSVRIFPDGADYLILERGTTELRHIVSYEPEDGSKGVTVVPTVGGAVLVGASERALKAERSATDEGALVFLTNSVQQFLPGLLHGNVIRSFAAVRPNPHRVVYRDGQYVPDGKSIGSFVIETPEPGYIGFIGIKTPGLTCADELGKLASKRVAEHLAVKQRTDFESRRKAAPSPRDMKFDERRAFIEKNPEYGNIICLCEEISEGEILDAIRRGAVSFDGVKRRCGASLGACQGSRCRYKIEQLLSHERGN